MNMGLYDWGFQTEPEPHLGGRILATPRGKVIGGSSSINGMVYVRGHARDFDHWAEQGAQGWSYADVLPYFQRMEDWHDSGHGGDPSWRGKGGPLHVTRGKRDNPLTQAFVKAGEQAGYPVTHDYNGQQQEGFGPMEATIWHGRRWSAASAYLRPASRPATPPSSAASPAGSSSTTTAPPASKSTVATAPRSSPPGPRSSSPPPRSTRRNS